MSVVSPIQSRVPFDDYRAVQALNISSLKELRHSPQVFKYRLHNPKESAPMTLGTAAHCATLEPERFAHDFAIWSKRTSAGKMSPRSGKDWEAFTFEAGAKTIITEDECSTALSIAAAVRSNPVALKYLEAGEPEVTLTWERDGRACKGRVDWLTHLDGEPVIVGLKTAREARHFAFGNAAARLGYAEQWAWYFDGYRTITGNTPRMIEIVVESDPPHPVVVYAIPDDVMEQGRENIAGLIEILERCELENYWPGPAETEQTLTLPSWYYPSSDDVADLELQE